VPCSLAGCLTLRRVSRTSSAARTRLGRRDCHPTASIAATARRSMAGVTLHVDAPVSRQHERKGRDPVWLPTGAWALSRWSFERPSIRRLL